MREGGRIEGGKVRQSEKEVPGMTLFTSPLHNTCTQRQETDRKLSAITNLQKERSHVAEASEQLLGGGTNWYSRRV